MIIFRQKVMEIGITTDTDARTKKMYPSVHYYPQNYYLKYTIDWTDKM